MASEDRQVAVLANLDRSDPLVQAKLLGTVESDRFERFRFTHAAVLDALASFLVQMPHQFIAVGL